MGSLVLYFRCVMKLYGLGSFFYICGRKVVWWWLVVRIMLLIVGWSWVRVLVLLWNCIGLVGVNNEILMWVMGSFFFF